MTERSYDGSGNNLQEIQANAAGSGFIRIAEARYADGISTLAAGPNARDISNIVVGEGDADVANSLGLSGLMYAWGQFIDHDISRTPIDRSQSNDITIPEGDTVFLPGSVIPAGRAFTDPTTGTGPDNPATAINAVSGWLDGSMVYGSSAATAAGLRLADGHMRTSDGDNLPIVNGGFAAGDVRVMENPSLTALQTIFVREHNLWVDRLAAADPTLSGDALYQQARTIVTAEINHITFTEFLPKLLGGSAIADYAGYDASVDARIALEFAGAAYRWGHSTVSAETRRTDEQGVVVGGDVTLRDTFFMMPADFAAYGGADGFLRHLGSDVSQEMDVRIVDDLRNFLVDPPVGQDLAAINIARGRDLGLPTLNGMRLALGLEAYTEFAQITDDAATVAALAEAFGTVDAVDLWTGGLAERQAPGAFIGETFALVVADQFTRLRDGDRYWWENLDLDPTLKAAIGATQLSDIVLRTTDTLYLQDDMFLAHERRAPGAEPEDPDLPQLVVGDDSDETLEGGALDDILVGRGGRDTVLYHGLREETQLLRQADGSWLAVGPDGSDRLREVEFVQFADGRLHLGPAAARDFSGEGHAGLLWRNAEGLLYVWNFRDGEAHSHHGLTDMPLAWTLAGTGDIDGDGMADLAFTAADGGLRLVRANGIDVFEMHDLAPRPAGETVVGLGDLNGDGMADVVVRGLDGVVRLLETQRFGVVEEKVIGWLEPDWHVAAIGDFDGDGKADLLLRGESSGMSLWTQDGARTVSDVFLGRSGREWHVAGTGDFDGDGRTDVFWRQDGGNTWIWRMDGPQVVAQGGFGEVGEEWQVASVADFSGDGRDDIMWEREDGVLWLWQMDGIAIAKQGLAGFKPDGWELV
jgi:peroxidase